MSLRPIVADRGCRAEEGTDGRVLLEAGLAVDWLNPNHGLRESHTAAWDILGTAPANTETFMLAQT